jgi:hypothetical protein
MNKLSKIFETLAVPEAMAKKPQHVETSTFDFEQYCQAKIEASTLFTRSDLAEAWKYLVNNGTPVESVDFFVSSLTPEQAEDFLDRHTTFDEPVPFVSHDLRSLTVSLSHDSLRVELCVLPKDTEA